MTFKHNNRNNLLLNNEVQDWVVSSVPRVRITLYLLLGPIGGILDLVKLRSHIDHFVSTVTWDTIGIEANLIVIGQTPRT